MNICKNLIRYIPSQRELKSIFALSVPIIGGMLSQNLMNLIDTAMVGQLGGKALAVAGAGSFANFMASSLVMGLSAPVQAIASRRKGAGMCAILATPLNGGLILAIFIGIPLTFLSIYLNYRFFPLLQSDPFVTREGIIYLNYRLLALVGMGINFAFRGYWNAISLSKIYLKAVFYMQVVNVIFNWILIFGKFGAPQLGVHGAALASTLATYFGSFYYAVLAFKTARGEGFLREFPSLRELWTMFKIAVPAGAMRFAFAFGMTIFFSIIARATFFEDFALLVESGLAGIASPPLRGTLFLAASTILVNLLLIGILPGVGFGIAAATLAGQSLGKKRRKEALRWGFLVSSVAFVTIALFLIPPSFFAVSILRVFTSDIEVISIAKAPLRLLFLTLGIDAAGIVFLNALQGVGYTRPTFWISFSMQWFFGLPLAFIVGPIAGFGLIGIWSVQISYRLVQGFFFFLLWKQGRWTELNINP